MITGRVLGAIKKEEVALPLRNITANGDVAGVFKDISFVAGTGAEIQFLTVATAITDGVLKLKSIQFSNDGTNSAKEILAADLGDHIMNKNCSLTGTGAIDGEAINTTLGINKVRSLNYHIQASGFKYIRPVYVASGITTGMSVIGFVEMTQNSIPTLN